MRQPREIDIRDAFDKTPVEEVGVIIHQQLKKGEDFNTVAKIVSANVYANIVALLRALPKHERYYVACQLCGEITRQTLNWAIRGRS